jgi:hypothetical protein
MQTNPRKRKPTSDWIDKLEKEFGPLQLLEEAGMNSIDYINAKLAAGDGFELPVLHQQDLVAQALTNIVRRKHYRPLPANPQCDLVFGELFGTTTLVGISAKKPRRVLVTGASGSGKSNFIFVLMAALRKLGVKQLVWEYKPELRRIIPEWHDAIIFSPANAPWQFLVAIGPDRLAYYISIISEIRLEFELRPETTPLMWAVIERMLRGMRPEDPPFSWEDLRRVLEHEAAAQHRENLFTAGRAILNICVVLGRQASARVVPPIPDRYRVIGYNFVGTDPAIMRLFLGFEFTRLLFQAAEEGLVTDFRQTYVFDEGSTLFSTELMNRGVAQISAAKRFISMCRFTGTGIIIGCQNPSQIDPFVTQNCDELLVFRCQSVEDAILAARMLGLDPTASEELMRLPTGVAYARCADWEGPVKIKVPLFTP